MMDNNLDKKIRMLQAKKLRDLNQSISYSRMINLILEEGIKKF